MKKIKQTLTNSETLIYIGESIRYLDSYLKNKHTVIITDQNVYHHYGALFPDCPVIKIETGEKIKTLETVNYIYNKLLEYNVDRSSIIVGIGGGIVCDIAGFAAATYMRGVPHGFVATTLLAQADAAIGGKNGVNYAAPDSQTMYKNMIGTIKQPEFVICDIDTLKTLPDHEFGNGLAEIIKSALIGNKQLFEYLESNKDKISSDRSKILRHIITESIKVKTEIVGLDESEAGIRKILNFGHTFGHAVESVYGMTHGEAISIGMILALDISIKKLDMKKVILNRLKNLLSAFNLPDQLPELDITKIISILRQDKKKSGGNIDFIVLKDIGKPAIERISFDNLEELIKK